MPVEFQEDQGMRALNEQVQADSQASGVTNMIIKMGLAQDSESANKVMIVITLVALGLTAFIIYKFVL